MSNSLKDGRPRRMRPGIHATELFHVDALQEDADGPYVVLVNARTGEPFSLTDAQAAELVERINRALRLLPSSK